MKANSPRFLLLLSVFWWNNKFVFCEKVISIENGQIVGDFHDDFYAFRGIPYAEKPVGELRFAPPKRLSEKWEGVREFKNYSEVCAQYDHLPYVFTGIEDCLTVNVFVPKNVLDKSDKVPVIFYVHGGAFMFGSGAFYYSENIMKSQNMILVTINYRLGVLGFLSTEDEVIPGNYGMKDQVEALKWVQRNVAAFNGDPNKVTIAGYSAGGASVHLHYMSPLTNNLFNNGISHSGNALDPWVMMENAKEKSHKVAALMNCPQDDHKKMLKCLRQKSTEELVMTAKAFQPYLYNPFSPFGVVVEPLIDSAFLTDIPMKLLKSGKFQKLPWLLSQTKDEGLYPAAEFYNEKTLKEINDNWEQLAPFILDFNGTTTNEKTKLQVSKMIRKHYLNDLSISKENFMAFDNIITDWLFKYGAQKAIKLQSAFSPSYFYHFGYKSSYGLAEAMSHSPDFIGIAHGEDVFLIYLNDIRDFPYTQTDIKVGNNLIELYYNFAQYNSAIYSGIEIDPVKAENFRALEIISPENHRILQLDENFGNVKFWKNIEDILAGISKKVEL